VAVSQPKLPEPLEEDQPLNTYWYLVRQIAATLNSDGCSGVPEFHSDCCLEHDIHWRTGRTIDGEAITDMQANRRFWYCNAVKSRFGRWSPMAAWRFAGVLPLTAIRAVRKFTAA
jgi:hypothetical protein